MRSLVSLGRVMTLETDRASVEQFRIGLEAIESGTGRLVDEPNTDYEGTGVAFRAGDVLFGKLRPYLAKAWLADRAGAAVGDFHVYRPVPEALDSAYLRYVLLSEPFLSPVEAASQGAKMPRADWRFIRNIQISLPNSIAEQRAIADYLERETAQIDAFILKNEQLIALLAERRGAAIDRIVWSGLETPGPGAESVVEPAPPSPAHWHRRRNKNLFSERVDLSTGGIEELLTVSHITGVTPRSEKNVNMFEAESNKGYKLVRPGDLAVNTMWAWMGAAGVSRYEGIVSPAYGVYAPHATEYEPRYYDNLIRSTPYVAEMTRNSRGITSSRLRLYPNVLLAMPTVVPPLAEQRAIADHLDRATTRLNGAIMTAERGIALARERRAALISAAVTGSAELGA